MRQALKRFQWPFFKVVCIVVPSLLAGDALILLGLAVFGFIKPGNWAPVIIGVGLLGLALMLTLALLALLLLNVLLNGTRQLTISVALGAGCGAIITFLSASTHFSISLWAIVSLAFLALLSLTLTTCGGPLTRNRQQSQKPVSVPPAGPQRTKRANTPTPIFLVLGSIFVLGAVFGAGLVAKINPSSPFLWQSGVIGGCAFLLFYFATQGVVYLQDTYTRWPLLPYGVVLGFGVAYGFGAMIGAGIESMLDVHSQYTWLTAVGGGFAFLFFLLATQGLLLMVVRSIREQGKR